MMTRKFTKRSLLQRATRFVEQIASVPVLVVLILLSILFPTVLFPLHEIGDLRPLDLHAIYSPNQAYEYLAALGAEGRRAYTLWALTSDLAFPVVYSMTLSIALMLALRKALPATSRYLGMLPFLIVIADWFENLSLVMVARAFPERTDTLVIFASFATSMKWTLILVTILILVAAVVYSAASGIRNT